MTENELIKGCLKGDRKSQNLLFQQFGPMMLSVCMRYLKQKETAEDILINSFFKVFDKIGTYKSKGSFEGWIKRIVINECLMEIRRKKSQYLTISLDETFVEPEVMYDKTLEYEDIVSLLKELPDGYRTVFNLYVMEGYKHREIAEMLGISVNTSKSQLILARRKLQKMIKKKYSIKISA